MKKNDPSVLLVKKKVGSWHRAIRVEKVDFFKIISKAIVDGVTQNYPKLIKGLFDFGGAIKYQGKTEEKAFILIFSSLYRSCLDIIKTHEQFFNRVELVQKHILKNDLDLKLSDIELVIDFGFFERPDKLIFIDDFTALFKDWLLDCGLSSMQSGGLSKQLKSRFFISLISEWQENRGRYEEVFDFFARNPFYNSWHNYKRTIEYYNHFISEFNNIVFGDSKGMTLADIYINPNYSIHERCFLDNDPIIKSHKYNKRYDKTPFISTKSKDTIHDFAIDFLSKDAAKNLISKDSSILIVLGYPGQGKTSFCQKLIHDCVINDYHEKQDIYLVKFRNIREVKELIINPVKKLREHVSFQLEDELDKFEFVKSWLILDGLDELYMKEGLRHTEIEELCRELSRATEKYPELKIVLTTRYGYIDIERLKREDFTIVKLDPFDVQQQIEWLRKYKKFHSNCKLTISKIKQINKDENEYHHLRELVNQPIILQLVSRASFEITDSINRAKIYDILFSSLIDRKWARKGQIENLAGITKKELRRFLSDIAMHIFYSENEYIHKTELVELEATKVFLAKFDTSALKESLKGVMIAFYLQEVEKSPNDETNDSGNYAIEFLHKSLQEFLVAEKIWNKFKLLTRKWDDDYFVSNWEKVIMELYQVVSSKIISKEVFGYLDEIIDNDKETDKKEVACRLKSFFPDLVSRDFIHTKFYFSSTPPINLGINCFYLYWFVMKKCFPKQNYISADLKSRFCLLLKFYTEIAYHVNIDLSYQDLQDSFLHTLGFNECNLSNSNFSRSSFYRSHLNDCNFENSDLSNCIFSLSNLTGSSFKNADLKDVDFSGADLAETDFENSKNLTLEQLKAVYTIVDSKGIELDGLDIFEEQNPRLFSARRVEKGS